MHSEYPAPLTLELIQRFLSYDPETGHLRWKIGTGRIKAGYIAGTIDPSGYIRVAVAGNRMWAHRTCFALGHNMWPLTFDIDHKNGNPEDNRLANLRPANQSENIRNTGIWKNSSTGHKGVYRIKAVKSYEAYGAGITVNYKRIHLGSFRSKEEASAAYENAAKLLFGKFYRKS